MHEDDCLPCQAMLRRQEELIDEHDEHRFLIEYHKVRLMEVEAVLATMNMSIQNHDVMGHEGGVPSEPEGEPSDDGDESDPAL